jgi:hypothetical protein
MRNAGEYISVGFSGFVVQRGVDLCIGGEVNTMPGKDANARLRSAMTAIANVCTRRSNLRAQRNLGG